MRHVRVCELTMDQRQPSPETRVQSCVMKNYADFTKYIFLKGS